MCIHVCSSRLCWKVRERARRLLGHEVVAGLQAVGRLPLPVLGSAELLL